MTLLSLIYQDEGIKMLLRLHDTKEKKFMNKITEIFNNQKAFIAFITAGDPSLEKTEEFILIM